MAPKPAPVVPAPAPAPAPAPVPAPVPAPALNAAAPEFRPVSAALPPLPAPEETLTTTSDEKRPRPTSDLEFIFKKMGISKAARFSQLYGLVKYNYLTDPSSFVIVKADHLSGSDAQSHITIRHNYNWSYENPQTGDVVNVYNSTTYHLYFRIVPNPKTGRDMKLYMRLTTLDADRKPVPIIVWND